MCRVIQGRYLRYIQAFWGWIGAHIFSLQLSRHGPGITVQPIIDNEKNHSDVKIQLTGVISLLTAVTLIRENFARWRQHCRNVGVLFVIISVKLTTFPLLTNTNATQEPLPPFNCIVNCSSSLLLFAVRLSEWGKSGFPFMGGHESFTQLVRVPLLCFYHMLTSSVIYYWTDPRQHGIYLLYTMIRKEKSPIHIPAYPASRNYIFAVWAGVRTVALYDAYTTYLPPG